MLRDLIKEGGVYTFANLLTKGMALILVPYYAQELSTTDFGIYGILGIFGLFVTSLLCLQLNQGLGRYVAEPTIGTSEKRQMASSAIFFVSVLYLLGGIGLYFFPELFRQALSAETEIELKTFQLSVLSICLTGIYYFVGVYMRFLRMYKTVAVVSIAHALVNTTLIIVCVTYYKMGVDGIFLATILTAPFSIVAQLILLRKELLLVFNASALKPLFKFSLPLIPGALAYVVLNFTDRLFLKEISMAETGIYEMGSKFSQVIGLIILGISSALSPIVYAKRLNEETKSELARIFRLFIAAGSVGVLILSLFSYETLLIFTNEDYYRAAEIMPILYLSSFVFGFNMFYIGLNIQEKTRIIGIVVFISALLNILLNWILIDQFHMLGAAVATLISIAFSNLTLFLISQRYYYLKFPYSKLIYAFILLFGLLYLGTVELPKLDLGPWSLVAIKIGISALYIGFLYLIKLINFMKPLKHLRKQ